MSIYEIFSPPEIVAIDRKTQLLLDVAENLAHSVGLSHRLIRRCNVISSGARGRRIVRD